LVLDFDVLSREASKEMQYKNEVEILHFLGDGKVECTVRGWVSAYYQTISARKKEGSRLLATTKGMTREGTTIKSEIYNQNLSSFWF